MRAQSRAPALACPCSRTLGRPCFAHLWPISLAHILIYIHISFGPYPWPPLFRLAALHAAASLALSRGVTSVVDLGRYPFSDRNSPWRDLQAGHVLLIPMALHPCAANRCPLRCSSKRPRACDSFVTAPRAGDPAARCGRGPAAAAHRVAHAAEVQVRSWGPLACGRALSMCCLTCFSHIKSKGALLPDASTLHPRTGTGWQSGCAATAARTPAAGSLCRSAAWRCGTRLARSPCPAPRLSAGAARDGVSPAQPTGEMHSLPPCT
jgi:hypothetical protein